MKKLFLLLSLIVLILLMYLACVNFDNSVSLIYFRDSSYSVRISYLIISMVSIGFGVGAGILYLFLSEEQARNKAYKRELERSSIAGTTNASKVEVLEAKIKTLESAFNSVVDDRTKLEIQIKSLNAELENINRKNK